MSNLIDRQVAIDALKHNQDVYSHNFHDDPIDKYTTAIIASDIDSLVNLPSVQRWIPCSERMPEESGQYIITVKYVHVDGYEDLYAEHGEWDGDRWDMFCFGHCGQVEAITAWMPLPEPYKEKKDD